MKTTKPREADESGEKGLDSQAISSSKSTEENLPSGFDNEAAVANYENLVRR